MKFRLLMAFALGLACLDVASSAEEASTRRPNIVLVMADDLGWSDVGCYGGEIRTPQIDSLARDGMRFTQFYNNAICGPTRASLLTGLYCQQVGHRGDRWNEPKNFDKCATIAELLQAGGYRTMMVGKWQGRDLAVDRGFDRFFGPMCQAKISYFHQVAKNPFRLDRDHWKLPSDFYLTDAINEFAVQFLDEAVGQSQPFFLYVSHIAPHWPLHARETDIAAYRQQYRESGWDQWRQRRLRKQRELGVIPANWEMSPRPANIHDWSADTNKDWQAERMAAYAAQVEAIDRGLGELLQIIQNSGQADNTLVMFLSDNGAAPDGGLNPTTGGFGFTPKTRNDRWRKDGEPIRPGSGPGNPPGPHDTFAAYGLAWANLSNTPLRGTKQTGYEGGICTPLVARWPGEIRSRGEVTNQVGHVIDIMATCLDVADVKYPTEFNDRRLLPMEGKSLLPILQGHDRDGHEVLCWSVPKHHVVRMGRWKAVQPRSGGAWQLFDLEADGTETVDLAEQQPERTRGLADRFHQWRQRVEAR
ncbi:Arylsulfatase [Roseimaritima multifibrata]|uniref:Arylsulfatase n=1 Tax=Roseimaritima multifibrata TaxID=1930274 RepID=A0A517MC41_9BACT|nr:arylsulfatase [Roseimaritima multifibrata]QDS92454.1 Arylsulfatase [Roseimaritima multifibrata]